MYTIKKLKWSDMKNIGISRQGFGVLQARINPHMVYTIGENDHGGYWVDFSVSCVSRFSTNKTSIGEAKDVAQKHHEEEIKQYLNVSKEEVKK